MKLLTSLTTVGKVYLIQQALPQVFESLINEFELAKLISAGEREGSFDPVLEYLPLLIQFTSCRKLVLEGSAISKFVSH